jgi:hypothetical protein
MSYEVVLLCSRVAADDEAGPPPAATALAESLDHSRDWPAAAAAVATARAAVTLSEPLPAAETLTAFVARVAEAAAARACVAVWWKPAGRVVSPAALAAAARDENPLAVALNLRLFHVETGSADERVIDSLGLEPLGLPDVQCHFRGALDPALVAEVLLELARYLAEEGGDVIGDGDTVGGPDDTRWQCRREEALVNPPREVIDVSPPAPGGARADD